VSPFYRLEREDVTDYATQISLYAFPYIKPIGFIILLRFLLLAGAYIFIENRQKLSKLRIKYTPIFLIKMPPVLIFS